jgi:hypothetical protein
VVKPDLQRRLDEARQARREAAHRTAAPAAPAGPGQGDDDRPGPAPGGPAVIDLRTVHEVREATERTRQAAFDAAAARATPPRGPRSAFTGTPLAREAVRPTGPEPRTTTAPLQERCQACGGPLRLDLFDLVQSVAHLTCVDCGLLVTARSPRA